MSKRILITGSNGMLGQTLLAQLVDSEYEIFGVSRGENRYLQPEKVKYYNVDITDKVRFGKTLKAINPDVIINTAAMTNVDACEDQKEACFALNVEAVKTIVAYCKTNNTHLLHISTDFIFDGKQGYYKEDDAPNPLSYYGESKLLAEQAIIEANIKHTILRTILVYGKVHQMNKSNIVLWIKGALEKGQEVTIINDQFRMPTYVEELAKATILAMETNKTGIFNVSSSKLLSIYEIAQQVAKTFGLDASLIKPITTKALGQKAPRPPKTGFDLTKTIETLQFKPKTFAEDLKVFKQQLEKIDF